MASELLEMAREVGGDELAERIERLQDEIDEVEQQIESDLGETPTWRPSPPSGRFRTE